MTEQAARTFSGSTKKKRVSFGPLPTQQVPKITVLMTATTTTNETYSTAGSTSFRNLSRQLLGFLLSVLVMVRLNKKNKEGGNGDDKNNEEHKDDDGQMAEHAKKKEMRTSSGRRAVLMTGFMKEKEGTINDEIPDLEKNDSEETDSEETAPTTADNNDDYDQEKRWKDQRILFALVGSFVVGFFVVCGFLLARQQNATEMEAIVRSLETVEPSLIVSCFLHYPSFYICLGLVRTTQEQKHRSAFPKRAESTPARFVSGTLIVSRDITSFLLDIKTAPQMAD
eukprot:scaffold1051_cov119-Cylindrotheca_fusiformis.AAC.20